MIEIFIELESGNLSWSGERLASLQEYKGADRCFGSIFETLQPSEGIILQEGLFVLDQDLDPIALQEFADDLYMGDLAFKELVLRLEKINPGFASAVRANGLSPNLKVSESNSDKVLFDFESGQLFDNLSAEWRSWIASDDEHREEAYEACADWGIRFAAKVSERIL